MKYSGILKIFKFVKIQWLKDKSVDIMYILLLIILLI